MTGILIVDYWVIRRHKPIIPDLYSSKSIYWFNWALNCRAFLIFFVCTAPSMPGFVVNINGNSINMAWTRIYQYTWFFGYFLVCRASPPPGLGVQEVMPEYVVEGILVGSSEVETLSTSEHKLKHTVEVEGQVGTELRKSSSAVPLDLKYRLP